MAEGHPVLPAENKTVGGSPLIVMKDVWKIFGSRQAEALAAVRNDGAGKQEIAERFDCVIGDADVNI